MNYLTKYIEYLQQFDKMLENISYVTVFKHVMMDYVFKRLHTEIIFTFKPQPIMSTFSV